MGLLRTDLMLFALARILPRAIQHRWTAWLKDRAVIALGLFSLLVANQGLTQLISFSIPVLVGLYPLAIVLVALSLLDGFWLSSARVFRPVMAVALVFGLVDGLAAAGWAQWVPGFFSQLPLADQSLGWLLPVLVTLVLAAACDRLLGRTVAVAA